MNGYYAELDRIDDEIQQAYLDFIQLRTQLTEKFHDRINEIMSRHRDLVDFYLATEQITKENDK